MILNGYAASSKINESQNWQCLEFKLTAAAAGTPWTLLVGQQGAAEKVKAVTGDGAIDLLTLAQAQALVANDANSARAVRQAELDAIAADLVTYATNVPAAADGARALVAVIGGVSGLGQVLCAEIEWCGVGTAAANTCTRIRQVGPAVVATSATVTSTSATPLVVWPVGNVLAVAFAIPDVLDVPAAGAPVTIKVWVKP